MARRDPNVTPARNLQGVFVNTATDADDEMFVYVEDFSDRHGFGPVVWRPVYDGTDLVFPQAGDWAWITEFRGDLRSEWVVLLWKPA